MFILLFILLFILIFYIIGAGAYYIVELEGLEDKFPILYKRILLCILCGPMAWIAQLAIFICCIVIYFIEIFIYPILDWLKEN